MKTSAIFLSLVVSIIPVNDHERIIQDHWYDWDCCSAKDCRKSQPGELIYTTREGQTGWLLVETNDFLPELLRGTLNPNIRPSKDRWLHYCQPEAHDGSSLGLRCVYVPAARI